MSGGQTESQSWIPQGYLFSCDVHWRSAFHRFWPSVWHRERVCRSNSDEVHITQHATFLWVNKFIRWNCIRYRLFRTHTPEERQLKRLYITHMLSLLWSYTSHYLLRLETGTRFANIHTRYIHTSINYVPSRNCLNRTWLIVHDDAEIATRTKSA